MDHWLYMASSTCTAHYDVSDEWNEQYELMAPEWVGLNILFCSDLVEYTTQLQTTEKAPRDRTWAKLVSWTRPFGRRAVATGHGRSGIISSRPIWTRAYNLQSISALWLKGIYVVNIIVVTIDYYLNTS